jgi:hypothetical protein
MSPLPSGPRRALASLAPLGLGLVLAALALAGLARYRLVEPADLTAVCDAAPWEGAVCTLRSLTVQAFAAQRLGLAAMACALLALVTRWRWAALTGLALGSAGLVLYSVGWAAPAVLIAALVLVRPGGESGSVQQVLVER